jgi:hypothetical protein
MTWKDGFLEHKSMY